MTPQLDVKNADLYEIKGRLVMNRRNRRGFTLIEVMVVVGIIALLGTLGFAMLGRMRDKAEIREVASGIVSDLRHARSLAKSGTVPTNGWPANARTMQAGIRVVSPTSYTIFVDSDNQPNGAASEAAIEVVNLPTKYGSTTVTITAPLAGSEIRFRRNGTLTTPADVTLTVTDSNGGAVRTITVTYGGSATFL